MVGCIENGRSRAHSRDQVWSRRLHKHSHYRCRFQQVVAGTGHPAAGFAGCRVGVPSAESAHGTRSVPTTLRHTECAYYMGFLSSKSELDFLGQNSFLLSRLRAAPRWNSRAAARWGATKLQSFWAPQARGRVQNRTSRASGWCRLSQVPKSWEATRDGVAQGSFPA